MHERFLEGGGLRMHHRVRKLPPSKVFSGIDAFTRS
jgi:hypothetical protein